MQFSVIKFSGKTTRGFLNAYTTKNWKDVSLSCLQTSAFLNQKGRVVVIAHLKLSDENEAYCYLPAEAVPLLIDHLNPYLKINRITYEVNPELISSFFKNTDITADTFVPWLTTEAQGMYTAHDLSLDVLNMIDFDKGCYLGQEIAARMDARMTSFKKRLALIPSNLLPPDSITLGIKEGFILTVVDVENFYQKASCQVWDNSRK
jgi:folate-binding protein YgfZ